MKHFECKPAQKLSFAFREYRMNGLSILLTRRHQSATPIPKEGQMLVLSRKRLESIWINDNIVVTVLEVRGKIVRLGIDAPKDVHVLRSELSKHLPKIAP